MDKHRFYWMLYLLLLCALKSRAQSIAGPYQLKTTEGQSLVEAIERLATEYHIDFAYAPEVLEKQHLPATQLTAPDIGSLLHQLLVNQPIQYRLLADNRILLRSISLQQEFPTPSSLSLSGRIIEAATGQPMMNVAIALDTLNLGTLTDEKGFFSLELPASFREHSVWIYHIGYKSRQLPLSGLRGGENISLYAEPFSLNEIVIVDQLPDVIASAIDGGLHLRQDAIEGNAASQAFGKDIMREVQLQAGVSADNDLSTDIKIRGSNADETLIVLDGMPLYKVDHFYGIFSALNSSFIEEATLYKNALPIQYGGRTGGMLLLRSTDSISHLGGEADLNLLSASIMAEIPLSRQLALSVSGRRSHTNIADSKLFDWVGANVDNYTDVQTQESRPDIVETRPEFGFSDWNAKLLFAPAANHRFAFNFYRSEDDYLNTYFNDFDARHNFERFQLQEDFYHQQAWQNTGTSIQYKGELGNGWQATADLFYTGYRFSEVMQVDISRISLRQDTTRNSLLNRQFNEVENAGYRVVFGKNYGSDERLQVGTSLNQYTTDFSIRSELDTLLASEGRSFDTQLFADYSWSPVKDLYLSLGGRLNFYEQTRNLYFSPRLTAGYNFASGLRLKSSYSINYQFIREITHENRLGQSVDVVVLSDDRRFPVGKSVNYMLGATYQFRHWLFDLELFHKDLINVIDHSSVNLGFGDEPLRPADPQNYRIFVGEGAVNGLDATIGWDYTRYTGQLAYTLSKSINSFPQIQAGAVIPARDDRRHQLKWINTYKLGQFDLSANLIYSSGRPYYNPARVSRDQRDRRDLPLKQVVSWLPAYLRLDMGVAYKFKVGPANARVGASIFNLTNNQNVKYLQFIYSFNSEENNRVMNTIIGSQTDLLDRTLNLSFGLEF